MKWISCSLAAIALAAITSSCRSDDGFDLDSGSNTISFEVTAVEAGHPSRTCMLSEQCGADTLYL